MPLPRLCLACPLCLFLVAAVRADEPPPDQALQSFLDALRARGVAPGPVRLVEDPAAGAVVLARKAM